MPVLPMAIAFVVAALGAAFVGREAGWETVLAGAALAAAMTGIATSVLQFLPERLFVLFTIVAGLAVAILVSAVLLALADIVGFGPITTPTILVWPAAAMLALVVSRVLGARLPSVNRTARPR